MVGYWKVSYNEDPLPPDTFGMEADGTYIMQGIGCRMNVRGTAHVFDGGIYTRLILPGKGPIGFILKPDGQGSQSGYLTETPVSRSRCAVVGVLFIGVLLSMCGCESDQAIIWQADVVSPDGRYKVHAETVQQSGPGNAWVSTEVKLAQKGQEKGVDILVLSHDRLPQPVQDAVRMAWVDGKNLRLEWLSGSEVDFQAVRAMGVDIKALPRI
ncbi:hypothetical protein [Luteibacter yeojuensis]